MYYPAPKPPYLQSEWKDYKALGDVGQWGHQNQPALTSNPCSNSYSSAPRAR